MKWKRDIVEDPYISLTLVLLVIIGAASFYVHSYVGLGIFLLMILYFRVHQWYLSKVGEGISIGRTTKRLRLHCDEEQKWEFQIQNKGMSIWGATLKISFKDIVIPTVHPTRQAWRTRLKCPFLSPSVKTMKEASLFPLKEKGGDYAR